MNEQDQLMKSSFQTRQDHWGKLVSYFCITVIGLLVISIIYFIAARGLNMFIKDGVSLKDFLTGMTWDPTVTDAHGKPEVGAVLVNPQGEVTRIETLQNEDKSETESTVTFDVRFTVLAPDSGEEIKLIINLEAQNDFHPGYPLIKRGVYYCARLISSQYGTVFVKQISEHTHYYIYSTR